MTIVNDVEFVEGKHKLIRLCRRNHDYKGSGRSLCRENASTCIYCQRENTERHRQAKRPEKLALAKAADLLIPTSIVDAIRFNEQKHVLGELCINRHDYKGTRQSLRRKRKDAVTSAGNCLYCQQQNDKARQAVKIKKKHENGTIGNNCACQECMERKHGTTEEIDFDTSLFRLGGLCIGKHE